MFRIYNPTSINSLENRYYSEITTSKFSLDTTFGPDKNGKVVTDINNSDDIAYSMQLDTQGKIYLAGFTDATSAGPSGPSGPTYNFAIVRYNNNGDLDTTFGPDKNGKVVTDINNSSDIVFTMQLDATHGKIYLAGLTTATSVGPSGPSGPSANFAIVRYNNNGDLDTTFGPDKNGKVVTDISNSDDEGHSMQLDTQGKIYLSGYTDAESAGPSGPSGPTRNFAIVRYNNDGDLDTTFGPDKNGKVVTDISNSDDRGNSMQLDTYGKIYLAGFTNATTSGPSGPLGPGDNFSIVRYNNDGNLDTTFGPDKNGKVVTDINNSDDYVNSMQLDTYGKIYLAGFTNATSAGPSGPSGPTYNFAIVRYNNNGDLDTTFGPDKNGRVVTDVNNSSDAISKIQLDTRGKIYLTGLTTALSAGPSGPSGPSANFAIVRYNNNGDLDTTFGPNKNGKVVTDINGSNDSVYSIQLDTRGKIYVAGYTDATSAGPSGPSGPALNFAIVRYNIDKKERIIQTTNIKFRKY